MDKTLKLVPLLFCLAACGGTTQIDPCASVDMGSCISLRVTGSGKVDSLLIQAKTAFDGQQTSHFGTLEALPVRVAIIPVAGASGDETFTVSGYAGTTLVGVGSASHELTSTLNRFELEVALTHEGPTVADEDAAVPPDAGSPVDAARANDAATCTPSVALSCGASNTLVSCNSSGNGTTTTTCPYGCIDANTTPHCAVFTPHAPVTTDLLDGVPDGGVIEISGAVTINTDTGAISGLRDPNDVATESQVKAGIGYQQLNAVSSVFFADGFDFALGATAIVTGSRPLVLVAKDSIVVSGVIDARPFGSPGGTPALCSQGGSSAGGFAGGTRTGAGTGVGGGLGGGNPGLASGIGSSSSGGGGGGGHADTGGLGASGNHGTLMPTAGGNGGGEVALQSPIVGGSGGGAGSGSAIGGAGGGAVQLVAGNTIQIGDGTATAAVGINVSGCGGQSGAMSGSPSGGGAGGTVLLEAPTVTLAPFGAVVGNGGGGAGGDSPSPSASPLSSTAASGGARDTGGGEANAGGAGGANTQLGGSNGSAAIGNETLGGGAGGGAAGRIAIFNFIGGITIDSPAFISPAAGAKDAANTTAAVLATKILLQ